MLYVARRTTASRDHLNSNICITVYAYILYFINQRYLLLSMEKYVGKYVTVKTLNKKQETKRSVVDPRDCSKNRMTLFELAE